MLTITDAVIRYRRGNFSLGPVSFAVMPGEIWAVLGRNGVGKSTLFRAISGSRSNAYAASGAIACDGEVEYVPQGLAVPGRLSVQDLLEYAALLREIPRGSRAARIADVLEKAQLTEQKRSRVSTLSGGQQRRLVIGQALLASAHVYLFDEPSSGLDIVQRAELRSVLSGLSADAGVLISSHIVEDLAGLATHVLHLDEGRQIFAGTAAEYLGEGADLSSTEVWNQAYRRHLGIP